MNPISVIIVNFNGGPLLSDCVQAVLASSIPVEVIVADNRSEDASMAELLARFSGEPRLQVVQHPENYGFAKANNLALPHAHGDYILFLNPDCIIEPDTLEKMQAVMEEHPEAGMAGCLIRNPDGSEQAGCRRSVPTPWRTFIRLSRLSKFSRYHPKFHSYVHTGLPVPEKPTDVEAISGAFMLVRRSAIDQIGPMDDGYFMHCEDLDWCMRFHRSGLQILFVPDAEIMHVGGVCSASRPIAVEYYKHVGMVRFYRKFFRDQYPAVLMGLVLLAIGFRFLCRAALLLVKNKFSPAMSESCGQIPGLPYLTSLRKSLPPPLHKAIVTGATSLIGDYLLPELVEHRFEVHAISRNPPAYCRYPHIFWHRYDIVTERFPETYGADTLIHLAPLATLPALLRSIAPQGHLQRIIAFSSTSLFTKLDSRDGKERALAQGLEKSEEELARICAEYGIAWTIFRPTLVYNLGRDKNVTTIANFIRRFGFFPLVGEGKGLRQPVHAEDLAHACMRAMENRKTFDRAYNLSGGETLSYRKMVERIFSGIGRKCRIITIPLPLLRVCLGALSRLPLYRHLTPEMANRINRDMCFDHLEAEADFGFQARRFIA